MLAVVGIDLDGGDMKSTTHTGYIGDLVASVLSYIGVPFLQVEYGFIDAHNFQFELHRNISAIKYFFN